MTDPITANGLAWVTQQVLSAGITSAVQRAVNGVRRQKQRHDLTGGANPTSDVDVTVEHYRPALNPQPVILTLQNLANNDTGGVPYPMVLTETAHLRVNRGHYLLTALVIDLPMSPTGLPTLRGFGWQHHWIASNTAIRLKLTTQRPDKGVLQRFGLIKSDRSDAFQLPPEDPAPLFLTQAVRQAPRSIAPPPQPQSCPARTDRGARCQWPVAKGRTLCTVHENELRYGIKIYDHATGNRIVAD